MSLLVDGKQPGSVCALFHVIRMFGEVCAFPSRVIDGEMRHRDQALSRTASILPRLLTSFKPTITDASTGNNALHEVFLRVAPNTPTSLCFILVGSLVKRGVDIHQRNKRGHTVALALAAGIAPATTCVFGLLLKHGADINAQDDSGDAMLHHFIRRVSVESMRNMFLCCNSLGIDLFVCNRSGQTPIDLANSADHKQIYRIMRSQIHVWESRFQPRVLDELSFWLVPDLAKMVLGYVDGSGPPFVANQPQEREQLLSVHEG